MLLGVLLARVIRVPIPLGPGLTALSIFAIGILVTNHLTFVARYTVCFSPDLIARCIDWEYLFWFAAHVVLGVLASVALARLGGGRRDALILGGVLFVTYLPGPVHQFVMIWGDGLPAVLGNLGALAGVLTFVLLSLRAQRGRREYRWHGVRLPPTRRPPTEPSFSGAPRVRPPDTRSAGAAARPPRED